ncbi:MAG: peptidase G2 autoproteolytic cleavage domain-containing protein [Eubacteriales bacterium]|nr:peptidase G2 autoproteolytic cleavage domain-containing protein [Eubacteriales bacterium]
MVLTLIRQKLNPDYDNSQTYIPRSERPEWDAVGMMGKLVVLDDGSRAVNGWCSVGQNGVAVNSDTKTKYRVMERLDETHIRVLVMP